MLRGLILVLALLSATSSRANVLTEDDIHRFRDFEYKAASLHKDVGDVERSASAASVKECLLDLARDINEVGDLSAPVGDLVALDVEMVDPSDEQAIIRYLRIDMDHFLRGVAIDRKDVNAIVGQCASSGAVAAKAQEILRLFDEGTALVGAISKKIGTQR